jgi:hypothetical protein
MSSTGSTCFFGNVAAAWIPFLQLDELYQKIGLLTRPQLLALFLFFLREGGDINHSAS